MLQADLSHSTLIGCSFNQAELTGVQFGHCRLDGAQFINAFGSGVVFDQASLNRGQFKNASLPSSRWQGAQLKGILDASKELLIIISDFDIQLSPKEKADMDMVLAEYKAEQEALREAERLMRLEEQREVIKALLPEKSFLEAAEFDMGSAEGMGYADERPQHKVSLDYSFEVAQTQVTQGLYEAVMNSNPSHFQGDKLEESESYYERPVERLSWFDALRFCNQLSELLELEPAYDISADQVRWVNSANGYRLPTEAEWEYFAAAHESSSYAGSENADEVAWHGESAMGITHPVAKLKANPFGLYDCSGNVWEWCFDQWHAQAYQERVEGALNPVCTDRVFDDDKPRERVARGGSWFGESDQCRVTYRASFPEDYSVGTLGLRLVKGAVQLDELQQNSLESETHMQASTQYEPVSPSDFASPEMTLPVGELTIPADLAQPELDSQAPEEHSQNLDNSTYLGNEQED